MFDVVDLTMRCRGAAAEVVGLVSDDELLVAAVGLQAVRWALDVAEAHVLGELRVRGVTDRCFGLGTARWVAGQAKVDHRAVARRERWGCWLRQLPVVDAAVVGGSISADHGGVVAEAAANPRVGDQVAVTQSVWVELAAGTSFVDWKHQVDRAVALVDQDGGFDPGRDRARNRLRFTEFADGVTRVSGDLVGVEALTVRRCVEARADQLFHQLDSDEDRTADLAVPGRATVLALALAELVREGSMVDRDRSSGPAVDVTLVIEATTPAVSPRAPVGEVVSDPYVPGDGRAAVLHRHC
ncbi:MAG: hypothetical protein ACXWBN_12665, partial [Acidimicrobiales bacterium]